MSAKTCIALVRLMNSEGFVPDSCSIEIGPIQAGRYGEFGIGWIAVGLAGNGYLFPWTLPDLIARAESESSVQALMQLCRQTWPVAPGTPDVKVQSLREQMGKYWPYDRLDLPWDWYWGLQGIL